LKDLFNSTIKKRTILIFEANRWHSECLPGFSKYFIDLGYKIDILAGDLGFDSFCLFRDMTKIRYFKYKNLEPLWKYNKKLISVIKKYDYIIIQTADEKNKVLFNHLDLLKLNSTIFVFHNISVAIHHYSRYFNKNRVWALGNFSKGFQVNPHYFGHIQIKNKNEKTIFLITSTKNRNYNYLVQSLIKLHKDNLNFEIIVVGRKKFFDKRKIPRVLTPYISYKYDASFYQFYNTVINSDFIIIPLDPKSNFDNFFRTIKVTGSAQLSYGFIKPLIIDKKFSEFYSLNEKNSLIYENNDLYTIMKKAINLTNKQYRYLQNNLKETAKLIYKKSIDNVKKTFNKNNKD